MEDLQDSALHEAVRYGDAEETVNALQNGCDPNQIGLYQWSALHEAAHNGDLDILKLLVKYEGDANQADLLKGNTAVHYAAREGHVDCLSLLLANGGRTDVQNNDGQTCLDIATGDCIPILNQHKAKELSTEPVLTSSNKKDDSSTPDIPSPPLSPITPDVKSVPSADACSLPSSARSDSSSLMGSDSISILSGGSSGSDIMHARPWVDGRVIKLTDKQLILGTIQMSFEYNSKKSKFKIRIWQLKDLLMPPVETSMISGLYVKSVLMPDKRRSTKRKTEMINVYKSAIPSNNNVPSILTPWQFKFNKALEYEKITPEMVKTRTIQLELCITQKYTFRSFCIASWSMPLCIAVRKLLKEDYPLTPRIGVCIPDNMKVYSANQLSVSHSSRPYWSNPTTRVPSAASFNQTQTERASSDSDLKLVSVQMPLPLPTIEITVPEGEESSLQDTLDTVATQETCTAASHDNDMSLRQVELDISCDDSDLQYAEGVDFTVATTQPNVHDHQLVPPISIRSDSPATTSLSSLDGSGIEPVDFSIGTSQPVRPKDQDVTIEMTDFDCQDYPTVHGEESENQKDHESSFYKWRRKLSRKEKKRTDSQCSDECEDGVIKDRRKSRDKNSNITRDESKPHRMSLTKKKRSSVTSDSGSETSSLETKRWSLTRISLDVKDKTTDKKKRKSLSKEGSSGGDLSPRSLGLDWDDYEETPTFSMVPLDFEFDICDDPKSPQFSMETRFDLPQVHHGMPAGTSAFSIALESQSDNNNSVSVSKHPALSRQHTLPNEVKEHQQASVVSEFRTSTPQSTSIHDVEMGVQDIELDEIFEV